jgi:pSer/pThr/pTyr-binding forkhead associated (FHA) protein
MAAATYELLCEKGPDNGRRFALSRPEMVVGRDPGCDIPLADEFASRRHARLIGEGDGHVLVNLSSVGTTVNGQSVTDRVALRIGDLVELGPYTRLRYVKADGKAASDPAAAKAARKSLPPAAAAAGTVMAPLPPVPAAPGGVVAPVFAPPTAVAPRIPASTTPAAAGTESTAVAPGGGDGGDGSPLLPAAAQGGDAGRKIKLLAGIGGYFVLLVGLFFALSSLKGRGSAPPPVMLDEEKIRRMVDETDVPTPANREEADKWLASAMSLYDTQTRRDEDLYRIYERIRGVSKFTSQEPIGRELTAMREARDLLSQRLHKEYHKAYVLDMAGQGEAAVRQYRRLRRMIPNHRLELFQIAVERELILTK